jgi:TonB-linked SusC/RagA family outer membrane protein
MYKIFTAPIRRKQSCYNPKFLKVMKLVFVFLFAGFLQLSAASYAQKVTLEVKKAPIQDVLYELTKQTGYNFICASDVLKDVKLITVSVKDEPLNLFLNRFLSEQLFTIVFDKDKNVLINRRVISNQQLTVSGVVKDDQGETLPGVNVKIKGEQTGIATDNDGKFTIKVPDSKSVLVFSYVGYLTVEKAVSENQFLNITLKQNAKSLNEVVVVEVGYGKVKRADLTGAVGSVNIKDLQKAPVASFDAALAGRVAGVQVESTDGQPGDGLNITIRGANSITGVNTPLYVIDGFPIENFDTNSINPLDIESIDILKDASATAIYGSRGANGVIIINTKRGRTGAPVVSYNGYYGFQDVTSRMNLMNPYQFVQLQNEINPTAAAALYFTNGQTLDSYKNVQGTDFQNLLYRIAPYQNHFVSITGGTDKTHYTISGSYFDQNGVIVASGYQRMQGRVTLDQQVNDKFKVGVDINYSDSKQYGTIPRTQTSTTTGNDVQYNLLYDVWTYRPVSGSEAGNSELLNDLLDPDLAGGDYRINPLSSAENEYNATFGNTTVLNGYLEYSITKDLKLRITGGANLRKSRNQIFNNSLTRSGSPLTIQGQANGFNGSINYSQINDFSDDNLLTYTKAFDSNNQLTLLGVYSLVDDGTQSYGFTNNHVPNENLGVSGLGSGLNVSTNSATSENTLESFTTRANYSLYNKYLFTGTFRADGSSKFAPNHKWGYFPSAAFAWKLGEENFIKKFQTISSAKLRASYGLTGNNRVSDFAYLTQINSTGASSYYPYGNTLTQGFVPTVLGNPNLKWETTSTIDAGLELGLFKDRISLEVDVYKKHTYNLLLNAPLPTSLGYSSNTVNIGQTQNEGLEITLNTINVQNKNFQWNSNFNISFNQNRILALNTGSDNLLTVPPGFTDNFKIPAYIAKVGAPIAQFYGYVFDGIYQYSDFDKLPNGTYVLKSNLAKTGGLLGTTPRQPGDPKYKDINGDGVINDADQTAIGTPYPIFTGGFNNDFTYKGFDLNVFLQFSYGNDVLDANRIFLEGGKPVTFGLNQYATYANRWTPTNPSNTLFRVNANGTRVFSSQYIEDASFIRLKTVSLGYTIPAKTIQKFGIKSLRLYSSAQNLYTLTKYKGPDPEVSTKGYGLTPNFDFSPYPRALTLIFGLNASF